MRQALTRARMLPLCSPSLRSSGRMGDVIHFTPLPANVQHPRWNTVEEYGRVGTLAVRIVASSDSPGQRCLIVMGGAAGFEVLAWASDEPDNVAALQTIAQRVIRVLEIAEVEFSGDPYHPQME